MSASTVGKGGGKAAAARAETKNKPRVVEWKGVKLETPAKLPGTLVLDIGRIDALAKRGEQPFGAAYELLESLIGPEGIDKVRTVAAAADEPFDVFTDVMGAVFETHGLTMGESTASAPS